MHGTKGRKHPQRGTRTGNPEAREGGVTGGAGHGSGPPGGNLIPRSREPDPRPERSVSVPAPAPVK